MTAEHESHVLDNKATISAWRVVSRPLETLSLCQMVQHWVASCMFYQAAVIVDGQMSI